MSRVQPDTHRLQQRPAHMSQEGSRNTESRTRAVRSEDLRAAPSAELLHHVLSLRALPPHAAPHRTTPSEHKFPPRGTAGHPLSLLLLFFSSSSVVVGSERCGSDDTDHTTPRCPGAPRPSAQEGRLETLLRRSSPPIGSVVRRDVTRALYKSEPAVETECEPGSEFPRWDSVLGVSCC